MKLFRRCISLLLLMAMLFTMIPTWAIDEVVGAEAETSAETSAETEDESEEKLAPDGETLIYYVTNGGTLADNLTESVSVPQGSTVTTPTGSEISRPGYEFGGWYGNEKLAGEKIESFIAIGEETDEAVLYAKWIERGFYITIPATVPTEDASKFEISSQGYGFFSNDKIEVSVESENGWKLDSDGSSVSYSISSTAGGKALKNGDTVASLGENQNQEVFFTKSDSTSTGKTADKLTFNVSFVPTTITVSFETNGGSTVEPVTIDAGTTVSELPSPEKEGLVFLGWCYDEECLILAKSTDEIISDTTFYAYYIEGSESGTESAAIYCHASDVEPDYVVKISSNEEMTVEEVSAALEVINANDPDATDFYVIAGEGTEFTVTAKNADGWNEGDNYRFIIDTDLLYFTEFVTDGQEMPDELDMTVSRDEVNNFSVRNDIKYLSISSISNLTVNGQAISSPTVADIIAQTDDENTSVATKGVFTSKSNLSVGDIVGVYVGSIPSYQDATTLISTSSKCKYIEITSKSGNNYTYRGADINDVLFKPDVIPVPLSADSDGVDDYSLRALEKYFIFKDGSLSAIGLTAETTVDVGDYIAFYQGNNISKAVVKSYARITSVDTEVDKTGVYYVIDYVPVTLEQMQTSNDTYVSRALSEEECAAIIDENESSLKADLLAYATDSDFVEDIAAKLAQSLLLTEGFRNRLIESNIDPDALTLSYGDTFTSNKYATLASGESESTVEVELKSITPLITGDLVYFEGKEGFRLTLDVEVEVTVHGKSADLIFAITGSFQQELKLGFSADADVIWETWNGIPYPADVEISMTTDVYEYTAMQIKVNVTVEGEDELGNDTVSFTLGGTAKKIYEKADEIKEKLEGISQSASKFLGTEDDELIATQLAEIYAEMLDSAEETDWVDVFSVSFVDETVSIYDVVEIHFNVSFVLSARMNLTAGASFSFATGKRYIFNFRASEGSFTNETVDLEPEVFEFTFYAVGTAGIRAGIEIKFDVGFLSTELDSIGFKVRVGAFIEAHGYYYYNYKRTISNGVKTVSSTSSGAVYFEVGMFLNIDFVANAAGLVEMNVKIFHGQWTLLTMGEVECVQSFVTKNYDKMIMKHAYKRAYLPDNNLVVEYLDLLEGANVYTNDSGEKVVKFFTKTIDIRDLDIEFTNKKFSFNYDLCCVEANPDPTDRSLDGELIVTYRGELAFSKEPIQIRIALHWDNYAKGYLIAFEPNGGSYIAPIFDSYGAKITQPDNPTRTGYRFTGWYTDIDCTVPYTFPETMPAQTTVLYAGWEYGTVDYKVEHYVQNISGVYELAETDLLSGQTGATVTPEQKDYAGFTPSATQTVKLASDSSTVVKYYYSRNYYTIVFKRSESDTSPITRKQKYGSSIFIPSFGQKGYILSGWDNEIPSLVPASDMTFVASWTPADDTEYRVCTYLQNANGIGYTLSSVEILTGTTGTTVNVTAPSVTNYHAVSKTVSGTISAEGDTRIDLYYDRNTYTITYDTSNGNSGTGTACASETYRFGSAVFTPTSSLKDFALVGWYTDKELTKEFDGIMPSSDITLYAKWLKGTAYLVEHYLMNVSGTYSDNATQSEYLYLQEGKGNTVTPEVLKFEGFTSPEAQTATVKADGSTVVKYYYTRNQYKVSFDIDGKVTDKTFYYGQAITADNPTKTGYTFTGFYPELPAKMPNYSLETTAQFKVNTYKVTYKLNYSASDVTNDFAYGASVTTYTPAARTGYTFGGWYTDSACKTAYTLPGTMPAENITVYAKWDAVKYTITYNLNGDSTNKATNNSANPAQYTIEDTITLKAPTRTNYDFKGWKVNGTVYSTYVIKKGTTGNITVDAVWEGSSGTIYFDVTYDSAGDEVILSNESSLTTSVSTIYGNSLPNIVVPKRDGWTFDGYTYNGTNIYSADGKPLISKWTYTGKVTLQPKWTVKSFTVYFHESLVSDQTLKYNNYQITMPSPTKSNAYFAGWATSDGSYEVDKTPGQVVTDLLDYEYTGSVNFYPIWICTYFSQENVLVKGSSYLNNGGSTRVNKNGKIVSSGDYALNGLFVNDDDDEEYTSGAYLTLPTSLTQSESCSFTNWYDDGTTFYGTATVGNKMVAGEVRRSIFNGALSVDLEKKFMNKLSISIRFDWTTLASGWVDYKVIAYTTDNKTITLAESSGELDTDQSSKYKTLTFNNQPVNIDFIAVRFSTHGSDEDCYIVNKVGISLTYSR